MRMDKMIGTIGMAAAAGAIVGFAVGVLRSRVVIHELMDVVYFDEDTDDIGCLWHRHKKAEKPADKTAESTSHEAAGAGKPDSRKEPVADAQSGCDAACSDCGGCELDDHGNPVAPGSACDADCSDCEGCELDDHGNPVVNTGK